MMGTSFPPPKVARVVERCFTLSLVRPDSTPSPSAGWHPHRVLYASEGGGGDEVRAAGTTLLCIQRPHCSQLGRGPSRSLAFQWGDTLGLWWCRDTPSLRTRAVCRICRTTCRPSHRLRRPPPLCTFCPSCSRCSHHWERRRPWKSPHLLVLLLPLQQRMSQI